MKTPKVCSVEECLRAPTCRGWCDKHYRRWLKHGNPESLKDFPPPEEAFAARTRWDESGCLIWTGAKTRSGYGNIWAHGRNQAAHRFAWVQEKGEIPEGLFLDHICHTRACVNTEHLRLATNAQNVSHRKGPNRERTENLPLNVRRNGRGFQVIMSKKAKSFIFGTYSTVEEAERVAREKRKIVFGEFGAP